MKRRLTKSKILTFALTLILSFGIGIAAERVYAYFTTYVTAKGTVPVSLENKTELTEEYENWKKTISVENTGEVPVYVRVKVFAGSQFNVTVEGEKWTENADGYYYYSEPLAVGATTDTITAAIEHSSDVISDFNIIVVQECTPVMYDENGNPTTSETADWQMQAEYTIDANEEEANE